MGLSFPCFGILMACVQVCMCVPIGKFDIEHAHILIVGKIFIQMAIGLKFFIDVVPSSEETFFQPPSMVCNVCISIIITQLHLTIHYRLLCAASMYCLYAPVSDMWVLIIIPCHNSNWN